MADKKKNNLVMVKTNELNDSELDAALDKALDALFGESENPKPAKKIKSVTRKSPRKKRSPGKRTK